MRTKTLLLTAVLSAAGITTSLAQPFASSYGVGLVNLDLAVNQFNLIANPLDGTNNSFNAVLPLPPEAVGTVVYRWITSAFTLTDAITFVDLTGSGPYVWADGFDDMGNPIIPAPLNPGEGFYIQPVLPQDDPRTMLTITFVGNIQVGNVATPLGGLNHTSFLASQTPAIGPPGAPGVAGTLELPSDNGDLIFLYDPITKFSEAYTRYIDVDHPANTGTWLDPNGSFSLGPVLHPAQGFVFTQVSSTATSWARTFSVN